MELAFASLASPERTAFVNAEGLNRLEGFDISKHPQRKAALANVLNACQGSEQFVRLVQKFSVSDRYGDLLAIAQQQPQSQVAVEAVKCLLEKNERKAVAAAIRSEDVKVAEATLAALGASGDGRAVKLLSDVIEDESLPIQRRRAALSAMGDIRQGAVALQEMAQKGDYDPRLEEALAATLHTVQWKDVKEFASKKFPLPPGKDSQPLPPIAELAERSGDPVRGSVLFHSTATCATCHQVGTLGKDVGPNLSEIGKKLSKEALYESILYPSAAISHNYENWLVVDEDGNQYAGLLVSETPATVELKDAKGIVHTIPTLTVEIEKKQDVSLMPADVQKTLAVEDLVDLVEFLTTLKEAKK
jgi:putative heme-binding domain-containing protein